MVFVDSHRGHNCADTPLVLTALLTSVVTGYESEKHEALSVPYRKRGDLLKAAAELSADRPLRSHPAGDTRLGGSRADR